MNEQDNILLNDYFNGLLRPADAQQVRERAAVEPDFGREFSLRADMEAYPKRAEGRRAFTETLITVEKDFFQETTTEKTQAEPPMTAKVNRQRWLTAIAASLVLLLGAFWFFNQNAVPEYKQYAQHAPLSLTVRGVNDEAISEAEKDFAAKEYAGALTALERVITADSSNITAQLYKGICLLELDDFAAARAVWVPIANGSSALRSEADWYTALSYLKEKNYPDCKATLQKIGPDDDSYKNAQGLLKKLE